MTPTIPQASTQGNAADIRVMRLLTGIGCLALGALLVVLSAYLWKFGREGISGDQGVWGAFGDYVGGILNPVIALAAMIVLIYGVYLQRQELSATKEELSHSNRIMQLQHEAMRHQSIESAFFKLMDLFSGVVRDLTTHNRHNVSICNRNLYPEQAFVGREVFNVIHNDLLNRKGGDQDSYMKIDAAERQEKAKSDYYFIFNRYADLLGHYFRTLHCILDFVDAAPVSEQDRRLYAQLLRAQLSRYELVLLFYNCAFPPDGNGKPFLLIEKYRVLEHLDCNDLVVPGHYEFMTIAGDCR